MRTTERNRAQQRRGRKSTLKDRSIRAWTSVHASVRSPEGSAIIGNVKRPNGYLPALATLAANRFVGKDQNCQHHSELKQHRAYVKNILRIKWLEPAGRVVAP